MQLGRYRLDEQVGQGGMAVVWRGYDSQLRRTVAVKVLHSHLHGREEIRRRFDREAHAVARLHHPHILDVYDFSGPQSEPSYLVMEFIAGTTLRAFADAHPFDPPELAAMCLLPLAEALDHAHGKGVIHRDLKPENVMVRADGMVKLTDFGIASIVEPDEKFTATGQILGSPAHLAPETIEGKPATVRSDLFSLGTILYWLSCGQLPFRAPTPAALLRTILEDDPKDPRMVRPSVSDGLARIIARCLRREPSERYESAAALSQDLTALLAGEGIEKPREELAAFVQGKPPEAVAGALRARLVSQAIERGQAALLAHRTGAALSLFGRALSLEPANAAAAGQVERIRRRARTQRLLRRGAASIAVAALLGAGAAKLLPGRSNAASGSSPAQPSTAHGATTPSHSTSTSNSSPSSPANPALASAANPTSAGSGNPPSPSTANTSSRSPSTSASPSAANPAGPTNPGSISQPPSPAGDPGADPSHRRDDPRPGRRPPRVAREGDAAPSRRPPGAPIEVTLKPQYPARVLVDGKDLGTDSFFKVPLAPGAHRVTVRKDCCADNTTIIDVTANRLHYPLPLGRPQNATILVTGAPPDDQVLLDGALLGTVQDLSRTPRSLRMDEPVHTFQLTVGDRSFAWPVKAGESQSFDVARHLAGGQ